ncbi:protein Cep78 homolog [Drosophila guanche]|uniref:Blast:Protein Cep78 homolog n=1 Tax=Drosophila guanche TaxID=7266 RepID=A0A3B0KPM0_DROGU|nr:protein Cep78 homolog [Drosophila guanche]SPP88569.1 blast:Protein Cep78 homolog [Drosophila guanche]
MSLGRVSEKKLTVPSLVKKSSKNRSFYFRYLELCRAKSLTPVPEIRRKCHEISSLELNADKLNVSDWLQINEALHNDLCLKTLVLRLQRSYEPNAIAPIDTENRARLFKQRPVVFTRFIFRGLVQSIANCVTSNMNLTELRLEGLPLHEGYIECIAKSLAANKGLEMLSFRRSPIGDKGCELVCNMAKSFHRIELFDLSECCITCKGAVHVAEMIKMQKVFRWEQAPQDESMLGLSTLLLANNPDMGDEGLQGIAEMLKEGAWIQVVDVQDCGLTDVGANLILECLNQNISITEFNVRNNEGISQLLHRSIRNHLATTEVEKRQQSEDDGSVPNGKQFTIDQLTAITKELEQQLSLERALRQKAEAMYTKLNDKLLTMAGHKPSDKEEQEHGSRSEVQANHTNMPEEYLENMSEDPIEFGSMLFPSLEMPPCSNLSSPRSNLSSPRSDSSALCDDEESEAQYGQSDLLEVKQVRCFRKKLKAPRDQVRKVRSEMQNEECKGKAENKNHESKSENEIANNRHYKLTPMHEVEQDIGVSILVAEKQRPCGRNKSMDKPMQ